MSTPPPVTPAAAPGGTVRVDPAYERLRQAVARLLPAGADGVRRPRPDRVGRTYWELGHLLDTHLGSCSVYGQGTIARLAADLGILPRTLYRARKVCRRLPADSPALTRLTWSHCRLLVTLDDDERRADLVRQAAAEGWSVRRLQAEMRDVSGPTPRPTRPGAVRVVAAANGLALDLGFGVLWPLAALAAAGKRTRRLLPDLKAGDTVELAADAKGRPALRRLWGHTQTRLHVYVVQALAAAGAGLVRIEVTLAPRLPWRGRVRLRPPADRLERSILEAALVRTPLPVLARSHHGPGGYEVDLFGLPDAADVARIATHGQHLNTAWAGGPGHPGDPQ